LILNIEKKTRITEQKVISKNIYKDPGIPIYMSNETKINWGELMFAIEKESSVKAVEVWEKIQKYAPKNDTVLYYGGIVYRNDLQDSKAIYYFKSNLKTESVFHDESTYFIAIQEWEKGNREKAKALLIKVQNCKNQDLKQFVVLNLKELSMVK